MKLQLGRPGEPRDRGVQLADDPRPEDELEAVLPLRVAEGAGRAGSVDECDGSGPVRRTDPRELPGGVCGAQSHILDYRLPASLA